MVGNYVKDKFIKLANTHFNKEDVFLSVTYIDSGSENSELLKDILRFYKIPLSREYRPTYELDACKELVKMIYFEEVGSGKVFWFLVDKNFARCYEV